MNGILMKSFAIYKDAKCFAYDGKRVCWTESLKMLNAFVKHAIEQTSVWWSPGD